MALPHKPPDTKKARIYKPRKRVSCKLMENAFQIRIGDLLKSFKRKHEKCSTIEFQSQGTRVEATLDLTEILKPVMKFRVAAEGGDFGSSQVICLKIIRPPLGGWTAHFTCPLLNAHGKVCSRSVACLYLPVPWREYQLGCSRCHKLQYSTRVLTFFRKAKLRKARREWALGRVSGKRRSAYETIIPETVPVAMWFDKIQYSAETLALIELQRQFDDVAERRFRPGSSG